MGTGDAEVWLGTGGTVVARSGTVDGERWVDVPGLGEFFFDDVAGEVQAHVRLGTPLRRVREAYRRAVVPMVMQARGTEVLHASAVLTTPGVLVLAGRSGVGKSTMAMGLVARGYRAWADDVVGWYPSESAPRALPLPFGLRLRPAAAVFFGRERRGPPAGKVRIGSPRPPSPHSASLAAVCVLERASEHDSAAVIERLSPSSAFRALLPHAFCFDLSDALCKRRMAERYLHLAVRVPCFVVRFAPGLARLPSLLDAIEQTVIRRAVDTGEGQHA